jgi:methionine-rich copper-binding protein CopC
MKYTLTVSVALALFILLELAACSSTSEGPSQSGGTTSTPVASAPSTPVGPQPVYDPATSKCLNTPSPTIDRSWQTSAPRDVLGLVHPGQSVTLGLRNKFGTPNESYFADARVIGPDGLSFDTANRLVSGQDWVYIDYPSGFLGHTVLTTAPPVQAGAYTVIWEINSGFVACDGFVVIQ